MPARKQTPPKASRPAPARPGTSASKRTAKAATAQGTAKRSKGSAPAQAAPAASGQATALTSATPRPMAARPTARKDAAPRSSYHHGDLRQALLDAADELITKHGVEGLTLRECARRAGVSHGAPAHHFGDVRGLLQALRETCFARFGAHLAAARDAAAPAPFEQLLAIGLAYVDFALQNPSHFRLMFSADKFGHSPDVSLGDDSGYQVLGECIAATDAAAGGDGSLVAEKSVLAHTLVHGFGTLVLENPLFYSRLRSEPQRAREFLTRLLRLARPAFEAQEVSAPG